MSKTLAECSHKEQCALPYADLLALRREAYAGVMENYPIPDEIKDWARKMEFRLINDGSYAEWCQKNQMVEDAGHKAGWVKTLSVWYQRLPLITAFMVIRWGEEPAEWPTTFTDEDTKRASTWFDKPKAHEGVSVATRNGV